MFSIESELRCWRRRLKNTPFFDDSYLSCGRVNSTLFSILNNSATCPYKDPDDIIDPTVFNFGIFMDALTSRVVELNTNFHHKFFYCFWWGLRNLRLVVDLLCLGTSMSLCSYRVNNLIMHLVNKCLSILIEFMYNIFLQ